MKRAAALIAAIAILFSFSACNSGSETHQTTAATPVQTDFNNYIGEGEKEIIRTLINAHAILVSDVFIQSRLPVDEKAATVINGVKYAPVNKDSQFQTYAELYDIISSTYTEEIASKLIGNPPVYLDSNGKLMCSLDYSSGYFTGEDKRYPYNWDNFEIEFGKIDGETIEFSAILTDLSGSKTPFPMKAVNVAGNWRLCDFYDLKDKPAETENN